MDQYQCSILIQAMATNARIEGMKAENDRCKVENWTPTWSQDHFEGYANDLSSLADQINRG